LQVLSLYQNLSRSISRTLTYIFVASGFVVFGFSLVQVIIEFGDAHRLVMSHSQTLIRNAVNDSDILSAQREVERFVSAINRLGNENMVLRAELDGRLIADTSSDSIQSSWFVAKFVENLRLQNGSQLNVSAKIFYAQRIMQFLLQIFIMSLIYLVLLLIFKRSLKKTISGIAAPLTQLNDYVVNEANRISNSSPEQLRDSKFGVMASHSSVSEVNSLSTSVNLFIAKLVQTAKRLTQEMAEKNAVQLQLAQEKAAALTVAMLAHDIRRPFTLLHLSLDSLESGIDKSSIVSAKIRVSQAVNAVEGMLEDAMLLGIDHLGRVEGVNLRSLVEESISEIAASEHSFLLDIGSDCIVDADRRKLSRVFSNLIANACEVMKISGTVRISARLQDSKYVICVDNDGPPIDLQLAEAIFRPFFTYGKKKGTGLGLAVSQKIILLHGSKISCEHSPDGWTRFAFSLPPSQIPVS
jgi:signal transduction histidine kinase